jgi:hypothetical protein
MLKCSLVAAALIALPALALAEGNPPAEQSPEAALQAALTEATASGVAHKAEAVRISGLLNAASTMLDTDAEDPKRVAAVKRLVADKDTRVLGLAKVGSRARSTAVRLAVLNAVSDWDTPAALSILEERAGAIGETLPVREVAIHAIRDRGDTEAAIFLYALANDQRIDPPARALALEALDSHFSAFMAERSRPAGGGTTFGLNVATGGNALTGAILLNSVGIWGQSESAPGIGSFSGLLIGASTAQWYGQSNPVSTGGGLAYSSNVTWGLVGGLLATDAIYGRQEGKAVKNTSALFRSIGVGVGAATGYTRMKTSPTPEQVWRINGAGFLGAQLGRSATRFGQSFGAIEYDCYLRTDAEVKACESSEIIDIRAKQRGRSAGILLGSGMGLAAGSLTQNHWAPNGEQALFAGVIGLEAMTASAMVPLIIDRPELVGPFMDLGFFTGVTAGLIGGHFQPMSVNQTALVGYGAVFGNLLATSATMIPNQPASTQTRASIILPSGLAGAALGGVLYPAIEPTPGDWAMVNVGTVLSAIHLGTGVFLLGEKRFHSETQAGNVIATGTILASGGFMAAAAHFDPQPIDAMFMATAATWGGFYGSVGQVATDANLSPRAAVIVGTSSMDLGLATGAVILSDLTEFGPRDTMIPQLFGVAGATMGSLGVMLGTSAAQPVSIGALTGATLGLGIGAVVAPKLNLGTGIGLFDGIPGPKLPGHWSFLALPAMQENGDMGAAMVLEAQGL